MDKLKFITNRLSLKFFLILVLCISSFASIAEVRRICKVQYQTEDGWSKEYTVEVTFITGRELNAATKSYNYSSYSNYCLIWFDKGQVAILEITDFLSSVGEDFDPEDFRNTFNFRTQIDCKQTNSEEKRKWRIIAKTLLGFIDPRENNQ